MIIQKIHIYYYYNYALVTSHAKRSLRFAVLKRIAVRKPFERDGMPFERLELSVQKELGAVRTAGAIRSKKIGSRSNLLREYTVPSARCLIHSLPMQTQSVCVIHMLS